MPERRLDARRLNRALLMRQSLLRRRRLDPIPMVERLVGLQAQVPRDPYVALWSRLDRFRPEALSSALEERRAVRMPLLRGTLHLVSADDALALRALLAPVLTRVLHTQSPFGRRLEGLNVAELEAVATALLEEQPRTRAELAPLLGARWPEHDGRSLAYAVTYLLPLVQVTPRGLWERSGRSAFTTLEHWLGRRLGGHVEPDETIVRYLTAYGPAAPADVQTWSGLQGVAEVLDRLRPRLRTFRDDAGRELFDVPGAPLPSADTPAPVRFLPEYDNAILSFADRARIVAPGTRALTDVGWGTFLVDGFLAGRWRLDGSKASALVRVESVRRLARAERAAVEEEGAALAGFLAAAADERDVRVTAAR